MRELFEEYITTARALERRSKELAVMMRSERNPFEYRRLDARRRLLDLERYELLRDINEMAGSLPEGDELYGKAV